MSVGPALLAGVLNRKALGVRVQCIYPAECILNTQRSIAFAKIDACFLEVCLPVRRAVDKIIWS